MNETVSVIVPVYNVADYLPLCMQTLFAQTVQELEILIINDGSTDGCGALCDGYARQDSRVRVIHKENGGLSSARNAGLACATGSYVCFVDPDDYIEKNLVEKALAALQKGPYDLCVYRTRHSYGNTVELIPALDVETVYTWQGQEKQADFLAAVFFSYKIAWGVCGRMFRRELIERQGLRFVSEREVFAEDLLFTYCYLLCAQSVVCIPDCLYHYVTRTDSLMNTAKRELVLPKYNKLMRIAQEFTKRAGAARVADAFPLFYTILLGRYAKNLWLQERLFTLPQIRAQFLAAEDSAFMREQTRRALECPKAVYKSQGRFLGGILLAQTRYVQSGNRLRFFVQALPCAACLFVANRLRRK